MVTIVIGLLMVLLGSYLTLHTPFWVGCFVAICGALTAHYGLKEKR